MPILTNNKLRKFISHAVVIVGLFLMCSVSASAATPASRVVLVRTKTGTTVYAVVNNQRVPINSPSELAAKGYSWKNLKIISDKKMQAIPLAKTESTDLAKINDNNTVTVMPAVPAKTSLPVSSIAVEQSSVAATENTQAVSEQKTNTRTEAQIIPISLNASDFLTGPKLNEEPGFGVLLGINNKGIILGREYTDTNHSSGVVMSDGNRKYLAGADELAGRVINDNGVIGVVKLGAGNSYEIGYEQPNQKRLFVKNLKNILFADVLDINNNNQIVGRVELACKAEGEDGGCMHAFITENGAMKDIGLGEAVSINDDGKVVYNSDNHIWIYQNGKKTDLGTLGAKAAYAKAINNSGQIVGSLNSEPDENGKYPPPGFVYNNGALDRFNATANDINNFGEVAGFIYNDKNNIQFEHGYTHAIVRKNGIIVDLNKYVPAGSTVVFTEALKINDNDQVLVAGYNGAHSLNEKNYFLINLPVNL